MYKTKTKDEALAWLDTYLFMELPKITGLVALTAPPRKALPKLF
jgi:hypothetical protein